MYNDKIFLKKIFNCSLFVALINLIFFLITKDIGWMSDGYTEVFSNKLFNLINEQSFFIKDAFFFSEGRFRPFFYLSFQLLPDDPVIFHGVTLIFFFFSSIFVFLLAHKISNSSNIAFLTSIFYTIHYSINIKALSWNVFNSHIINAFFGFLALYLFILFLEKKKIKILYLLFFISFSLIGALISESGLIYPLIASAFIIIFKRKNLILNLLLSFLPIIFYVLLVFLTSGKFLPILTERMQSERSEYYSKILNENNENELFFYRSTYAPRNFKGYTLRIFDNLLSSVNVSVLEKTIKFHDKNEYLKNFIKKNLIMFSVFFILFLVLFIFFIFKKINKIESKNTLLKVFCFYLIIFLIYTLIFFRKDLNIALSFPSTLILSIIIVDLYKKNEKIISTIIFLLFITPSLLYTSTSFQYFSNEHGPRESGYKSTKEYFNLSDSNKLDVSIEEYEGYRFFFYYQNYKMYEDYLKKFRGISYKNFMKEINRIN